MQKTGLQKYALIIIPILFLLYSAPGAMDYVFHFPDEKYYTDAVIQMMDKGDYFTPYKADGTPRFLKPISTYWVLMGSYKIFGVSKFSSRLFFWLAGALLVAVTFLMARSFSKKNKLGTIAAFITAANPLVLLSASRSIPDILLALFLTISAWGFLEIMLREKPKNKHYWMAYMGAAIAFETKGLPAAAFAGISMLYILFNPWKNVSLKKLLKPVPVICSVFVALSWFIIMYFEHGTTYLDSFFADQVGERVSSKISLVLKNGTLGILTLTGFLLPWILIAFSKPAQLRSYIKGTDSFQKSIFGFVLVWVVVILLMSAAVFKFYDRYILPVIPLTAILMAYIFTNSETGFKKTIVKIFVVLNLVVLIINTFYAVMIFPDTILILGTIAGMAVILTGLLGGLKKITPENILANYIMLLYFNAFILLYPLLMPNPGEQLVQALQRNHLAANDKVYVYGNIRAASNIRIHSHNKFDVVAMDTVYALPVEPNHILVFNEKDKVRLDLKDYEVFPGSEEWRRVPVEKFPGFLKNHILILKKNGTKYLIAKPKI